MTVSKNRIRDGGAKENQGNSARSSTRHETEGDTAGGFGLPGDLAAIADAIERLLPNHGIAFASLDEANGRLDWHKSDVLPPAAVLGSPVLAQMAQSGDGAVALAGAEGLSGELAALIGRSECRSLIVVPVRWTKVPVGLLCIVSREKGAYGDPELALAQEIASLVSGALAVDALRRDLDRQITELNAIAEMGRLLVSGTDQHERLERCAGMIRLLIEFDRFSVSIYDHDQDAIVTIYSTGTSQPAPDSSIKIPSSELKWFLDAGRAFMPSVKQMRSLAERAPGAKKVLDGMGVKSLISVPLRWQDQLVGAIQVFSAEEGKYSERDRVTMDRIANQISGALAVTRLTATLQEDVKERMVLADLSRILAAAEDPRGVVDPFANLLQELLPFDFLAVNIVDYVENVLVDWFNWGLQLSGTFPGNQQALQGTLTEHVASSRLVFRYCAANESDALENVPNSMTSVRSGIRSWLIAPLISHNRVVGTIHIQSRHSNAYGPATEPVIERVASQVAGFFANAVAHEREIALADEREKNLRLDVEKQELQRLNEIRDRFLEMVSHELKTPLTSVYAFANILARNNSQNLTERQLNHIRVIQRNSRRLDMMIGDLLDVSRIEQGTFSLVNRPFDIGALLAEVAESLGPIFAEKSQELEIVSDAGDEAVDGDRNRIAQVIANLISNASKYSPERDTIKLRAWVTGSRFTVSIEDHGVGIESHEIARVFEPFYRIDNDITRRAPGTGIGLFVARTIIEQHGGEIVVESTLGSGTLVQFWIPRAPLESADASAAG